LQKSDKNNHQNFNLPQNYFNNSAQSIKNKIECIEELKQFKILSAKIKTGFNIPQNYFENNEQNFENITYINLSLKHLKTNCFKVPLNYFENTESIISTTVLDKNYDFEKNNSLKQSTFQIPDNYFELSANQLKQTLKPKNKIITLNFSKTVLAMAASVIIVLSVVWFVKFYNVNIETCGSLACIDVNELKNSKVLENMDSEELYNAVNVNELENTLKNKITTKENKVETDSILEEFID